jgi:hypothetical protein
VNIAVSDSSVNGTVLLLAQNSRLEMTIVNARVNGATLEFETKESGSSWFWCLTLNGKREALLHGSIREMLIDEHVRKQP